MSYKRLTEAELNQIFKKLSRGILALHNFPTCPGQKTQIRNLINGLCNLDYHGSFIKVQSDAVLLVHRLCSVIPPDDLHFMSLSCALIQKLLVLEKINVEGQTLKLAINWVFNCLASTIGKELDINDKAYMVTIMLGLEALLRNQTITLLKEINLENLIRFLEEDELKHMVVMCLEALVAHDAQPQGIPACEAYHPLYNRITTIFIEFLQMNLSSFEKGDYIKYYSLKGLKHLVPMCKHFLNQELSMLMGICKIYIVYKLPSTEEFEVKRLMPSIITIVPSAAASTPVDKQKTKRRQRPIVSKIIKDDDGEILPVVTDITSSDEGDKEKLYKSENKIRQESLLLLLTISKKIEKSTLFSYFSQFIPDTFTTKGNFLTVAILKDPSTRGRMAALNCLLNILVTSKEYLLHAEGKTEVISFTPMSVTIAAIIKDLHHCLCLALKEASFTVLTQVLKCITALVQATPYHKLQPGLATKLMRNVRILISHPDSTVQVAAFIVLSTLLDVRPEVKEITEDEKFLDEAWLLFTALHHLEQSSVAPVQIESLQIISAMAHFWESMLYGHLDDVSSAIVSSLTEKSSDVRFHALKTVEQLGEVLPQGTMTAANFWHGIFEPMLGHATCNLAPLRSTLCDALATVGAMTYQLIKREFQIQIMTILLSLTRDTDNSVKSSAVRSIAIIVMYPEIRCDIGFIMDAADVILDHMEDSNAVVRAKASWSLGNFSEALVLNMNDKEDELPSDYLCQLISVAINATFNDIERVKANTVRALGNLLTLAEEHDERDMKSFTEGTNALLEAATTGNIMKVRWNACYALGNVLKQPKLYKHDPHLSQTIFKALGELVVDFKNFKVCINAAAAISGCQKREFYGTCYQSLWLKLLTALENSENINDFREYKHRDNLVEQICLTLGHMTSVLRPADLDGLAWLLSRFDKLLETQLRKVYDNLLPEKATILIKARKELNEICENELTTEQTETLMILLRSFNNEAMEIG